MRKLGIIVVLTLMVTALAAVPALADSPHWVGTPEASTDSAGNLLVSFKEAGLGPIKATMLRFDADATAVYVCVNRGNKVRKGETVTARIRAGLLIPVSNGQATGTITLDPPGAGRITCGKNQSLELASVTYSNITVGGDAGTITASPSSVVFTNPTVIQKR